MANTKQDFLEPMEPLLDSMAHWIYNLMLAYDPDDIVLGGSVGKFFWSIWLPEIQQRVNNMLSKYPLECNIRVSQLENAGALGAALFAQQE